MESDIKKIPFPSWDYPSNANLTPLLTTFKQKASLPALCCSHYLKALNTKHCLCARKGYVKICWQIVLYVGGGICKGGEMLESFLLCITYSLSRFGENCISSRIFFPSWNITTIYVFVSHYSIWLRWYKYLSLHSPLPENAIVGSPGSISGTRAHTPKKTGARSAAKTH